MPESPKPSSDVVIPRALLDEVAVAAADVGQTPQAFVLDAIQAALEEWGQGRGGNTQSLPRYQKPED